MALVVLGVAWLLGARIGTGTVANAILIGAFVDLLLDVEAIASLSDRPLAFRACLLAVAILVVGVGSGFYLGAAMGASPRPADARRPGVGPASGSGSCGHRRGRGSGGRGSPSAARSASAPSRSPSIGPAAEPRVRGFVRAGLATLHDGGRERRSPVMKGPRCAQEGRRPRLGELTRVANKHLLPVGRWPMIYYPLQLLERASVESVLVVTGKGHGGQMIDLLGDGRLTVRGSDEPLISLDLTYKVQTESGVAQVVAGMARDFARGEPLVVVLGDNVFERSQAGAIEAWRGAATVLRSSSRRSPTRRTSGSSCTRTARSPTSSRRPASSTPATPRRRRTRPWSASPLPARTCST